MVIFCAPPIARAGEPPRHFIVKIHRHAAGATAIRALRRRRWCAILTRPPLSPLRQTCEWQAALSAPSSAISPRPPSCEAGHLSDNTCTAASSSSSSRPTLALGDHPAAGSRSAGSGTDVQGTARSYASPAFTAANRRAYRHRQRSGRRRIDVGPGSGSSVSVTGWVFCGVNSVPEGLESAHW